jgi:hypothetical protein
VLLILFFCSSDNLIFPIICVSIVSSFFSSASGTVVFFTIFSFCLGSNLSLKSVIFILFSFVALYWLIMNSIQYFPASVDVNVVIQFSVLFSTLSQFRLIL